MKLLMKKAGARVAAHIARNSRVWKKAFKHIQLHFTKKGGAGKTSHAVFASKFQTEVAVKKLVATTASKPSRKAVLSKATNAGGQQVGRPCVVIEREFAEVIGTDHLGKPAKILRLVVDYTGRPLTAFPVSSFYKTTAKAAAKKGASKTGKAAAGAAAVLSAEVVLDAVDEAYAGELYERHLREEDQCAPQHWSDIIVDILGGSSCSADLDTSREDAERRASHVIRQIEKTAGALDEATKEHVRQDVYAIHGLLYELADEDVDYIEAPDDTGPIDVVEVFDPYTNKTYLIATEVYKEGGITRVTDHSGRRSYVFVRDGKQVPLNDVALDASVSHRVTKEMKLDKAPELPETVGP